MTATTGGACPNVYADVPDNWARVTRPIFEGDHEYTHTEAWWGPVLERRPHSVVISVHDEPFIAHSPFYDIRYGEET